jgi:hypothetical protein
MDEVSGMRHNRRRAVFRFLSLSLFLLILPLNPTFGQDVSIHENGGADPIFRGPDAAAAGTSLDQGDVGGGDNRRDLIIGSPGANNVGRVSIFFGAAGNSTGLIDLAPSNANATLEGSVAGARFGASTSAGYIFNIQAAGIERDLVVGAPGSSSSASYVYVFKGPILTGTRSAATAAVTIIGGVGERIGTTLATADLNGDGYREVIVGALGAEGIARSARVYVFNLRDRPAGIICRVGPGCASSAGGRFADMEIVEDDELLGSGLGEVIESGGDITGDGVYDLAIGLPRAYGTRGAVAVVRGHPAAEGWAFPGAQLVLTVTSVLLRGTDVGDRAGASLTFRDVVTSDTTGTRDLVIGAPGADGAGNARIDSGEVYIMWGASLCPGGMPCQRLLSAPDVVMYGAEPNMRTGERVTGGDVNRDNPDDLVLLAPGSGLAQLQVIYGTRTRSGYGGSVIDLATPGAIDRRVSGMNLTNILAYELTGEGANDIITSAPAADSGRGLVYVTISPKFALSSRTFAPTIGLCGTAAKLFEVQNPSIIPLPWTARLSSNTPWLSVVPPGSLSQRAQPGLVRLIANTSGLPAGAYTGSVEITSTSPHIVMFVRINVTLTVQVPAPMGSNAETDFSGDGCADTPMFRPGAGLWRVPGRGDVTLGMLGDLPVPGDYNGDLIAEPAVFRPTTGTWIFEGSQVTFGQVGDVPVPGDYDGDGDTDVAVYRPSTGQWFLRDIATIAFGAKGELPVPADYDGDGIVDIAVYMPGRGIWRIRNGATAQWGLGFDVPVPADYNGDGRADVAVYRRSNGMWYVKDQFSQQWGDARTFPIPLDVTRDGRADLVSFQRHNAGVWNVYDANTGVSSVVTFGGAGDVPAVAPALLTAMNPPKNDFDANGRVDLVWQQDGSRQAVVWFNDNGTLGTSSQRYAFLTSFDVTGWTLAAADDFNGDGIVDLVWQHDATRRAVVWYMGGTERNQMVSWSWLSASEVPGWKIVAARDFNGDGQPDLVWLNEASRQASVWFMGGQQGDRYDGWAWLSSGGAAGWGIVGVADLNHDGYNDVVWQHDGTRQVSVWYLGGQGTTFLGWAWLNANAVAGWHVVGVGDLNGDRTADLVWQNDTDRSASAWYMGGPQGATLQSYGMLTTFSVAGWTLSVR